MFKEHKVFSPISLPDDAVAADGASPHKLCTVCGNLKAFNDYYKKGSRIDSACKVCQKAKKRVIRSSKVVETGSTAFSNSKINTPSTPPKYPVIEPKRYSQAEEKPVSFEHWENRYGKHLTDLEKMEIKDNLMNLLNLLKNEERK